jgi:hypothetical protein
MNFQAMQFREFIYIPLVFLAIGLEIGTFVSTFATPKNNNNNNNKSSQDHLTSLSKQKGISTFDRQVPTRLKFEEAYI